jgi:hypothetical protein
MYVNAMPADYFAPAYHGLLIQLCRHRVASDRTGMLIEQVCKRKKINYTELQMLHAMQSAESGAIVRLCRQLRLSPQAVYRANAVAKLKPLPASQQQLPSPWDRKYDAGE